MLGKASVLVEKNRLETWDVTIADPESGGALVSVVLGGVCGSDVHILTGEAGEMPFPIILGHEGVGRVERLGAGVATDYAGAEIKTGDLVYWSPIALCRRCYSCTVLEETPQGVWVSGLRGPVRVITVGQSYVAEGQKVQFELKTDKMRGKVSAENLSLV